MLNLCSPDLFILPSGVMDPCLSEDNHTCQWRSQYGGEGWHSAPIDSEKFAKIGKKGAKKKEKEGEIRKKSGKGGKIGKKRQKSGRFFHFVPPDG